MQEHISDSFETFNEENIENHQNNNREKEEIIENKEVLDEEITQTPSDVEDAQHETQENSTEETDNIICSEVQDANEFLKIEIKEFKESIVALSDKFDTKLKYDKNKEEIIDKLHKENQVLKNDLYKKFVMPFVNEIIIMIDDYSMLYKKHLEDGVENIDTNKLLKQFGGISEDLEDVLYKNGIDVYTTDEEKFNPSKQKVMRTIETEDPEQNKNICEVIKKGFVMEEKIIRMEHVSCYKYNENKK